MEPVELKEAPSAARRRLSVAMDTNMNETTAAVARRGSTVAFRVAQDAPEKKAEAGQNRRVSVVGRRASAYSRMFAFSSTSESFIEEGLRPTLINGMLFFDDPKPDVNKLRQVLAERLLCIPRFRSIVRKNDDATVHWDPLPRSAVDLEDHLKVIDGKKKFNEDDIEDLVSNTFLQDWPSTKPLWRMTLVTNLADGRSMLFMVVDHTIGDGVGLLAVFLSLFDDQAENGAKLPSSTKASPQTAMKIPSLRWSHKTVAFVSGVYDGIIGTLAPPSDPVSSLMIPKKQLQTPCPGKAMAQTRAFPVMELLAMKKKLAGTTVNDVVLALLAMAIRKYFESTKEPALDKVLKGKGKIRADFPVNTRNYAATASNLGNNLCVASFPFPLDYEDPIDCVWKCKGRVDELKVSPAFYFRKLLGDAIMGKTPDTVLAPKVLELMNRSTCMISNVRGPDQGASFGGYKIDDLNFTTSFLGGLYFGVLTFGGNLRVSMILDERTKADVKKLRDCFEAAYDDFKDAVKDIDSNKPLTRPDMTPLSARLLELVVYVAAVAVPVMMAMWFKGE